MPVCGIFTSISIRLYALLDFREKGVDWALRVSPYYYNDEADLDRLEAALGELLG